MSRIPDPDITPEGPFYQGRPLDRPDEEVVDQGAPFDIRTVMSRRGVLGFAGLGIGAMILAACTAAPSASSASPSPSDGGGTDDTGAETDSEIPEETAGPYPADGTNGPDILERSGIVRRDITRSIDGGATATGVPLTIEFQLVDVANGGAPFAGAALYAWHCTAEGDYSMYSDGLEDVTYLRGVQVADAQGRVSFTSIFPGCYAGRWPHIHFEVYPDVASIADAAHAIATSQMALPQAESAAVYALDGYGGSARNLSAVSLAQDTVFGDDSASSQLATVSGDADAGYTATLVVPIDTRTAAASVSAPAGGPGGPRG